MLECTKTVVPPGTLDQQEALQIEQENIRAVRGKKVRYWSGIGLSGGGIRSATFCLGVLQRLAGAGVLSQVDYLSTVSGGSYIGASLQWFWHKDSTLNAADAFPYGTALHAQNTRLTILRNHGSYLTPGDGITFWSGIAVVLRTVILNAIVWFPLLMALLFLLYLPTYLHHGAPFQLPWGKGLYSYPISFLYLLFAAGGMVLFLLAWAILLAWTSILIPPESDNNGRERLVRASTCAVVGIGLLIITVIAYYLLRQSSKFASGYFTRTQDFAFLFSIGMFGAFSAWSILIAGLQLVGKLPVGLNYVLRRWFDSHAGSVLIRAALLGTAGLVPWIADAVVRAGLAYEKTTTFFGALTAVGGIVSGLYGHFVQAQRASPDPVSRWLAAVAAALFMYAVVVCAYLVVDLVFSDMPNLALLLPVLNAWIREISVVAVGSVLFAILFGWFSNLNHLGLHRFYRDRLMEAFMPSIRTGKWLRFSEAEGLNITEIWPPRGPAASSIPYPLVNTNVILVNDGNIKRQVRGGDNFILSPLLVGSSATGWQKTARHIAEHGPLTLASAMAGSGAAANANAGYVGSGITRDRIISVLMMLLNLRLGIWIGSPSGRPGRPNFFRPALTHGILRRGYKSDSRFVELSDGGHFDNLGIYELIRRKVDLLLIVDAEEDPMTAMTALVSVCQRVREDFGAEIDIGDAVDVFFAKDRDGYPIGAKFAAQPFFVCTVTYSKQEKAVLVYIKANMIKGLGFTVRGYRASNPAFPNQPTADQFFDAAQFEAYRELGYASAENFIDAFALNESQLLPTIFGKLNVPVPSEEKG
jgi:hypothetical protein